MWKEERAPVLVRATKRKTPAPVRRRLAVVSWGAVLRTLTAPLHAQLPRVPCMIGRPFVYRVGAARGQHTSACAWGAPATTPFLRRAPTALPAQRAPVHSAAQRPAPRREMLTMAPIYTGAAFLRAPPALCTDFLPRWTRRLAPRGAPLRALAPALRERPPCIHARSLRFPCSSLTKGMDGYLAIGHARCPACNCTRLRAAAPSPAWTS